MLIDGEKWACEACVRGHRVSTCKHHDRPLVHINRKGRPFSTCSICHRTPCTAPDEHARLRREAELSQAQMQNRAAGRYGHARLTAPLAIAPRPMLVPGLGPTSPPVSASTAESSHSDQGPVYRRESHPVSGTVSSSTVSARARSMTAPGPQYDIPPGFTPTQYSTGNQTQGFSSLAMPLDAFPPTCSISGMAVPGVSAMALSLSDPFQPSFMEMSASGSIPAFPPLEGETYDFGGVGLEDGFGAVPGAGDWGLFSGQYGAREPG